MRLVSPRGCSPFSGSGGVLVGAHDGGVDLGVQVGFGGGVDEVLFDAGPGAVDLPAQEPVVDGAPGAVAFGQVTPGDTGTGPVDDAVEDLAVVAPAASALVCHRGQQGPDQVPLLVGELESAAHVPVVHRPLEPQIRDSRSTEHALGDYEDSLPDLRWPIRVGDGYEMLNRLQALEVLEEVSPWPDVDPPGTLAGLTDRE